MTSGMRVRVLAPALALAVFFSLAGAAQAALTKTEDGNAAAAAVADGVPGGATGAFTNYGTTQCADGEDNDGDTDVDLSDIDCESTADNNEEPSIGESAPECQDLADNDDDNQLDTADGGCTGPLDADEGTAGNQDTQCETATDDDGDADGGDFQLGAGGDPDCVSPNDDTESIVEDCADTEDNDEDGQTDMADPDCTFPYDDAEFPALGHPIAPAAIGDAPLASFPRAGASFLVLSSGNAAQIAPGADQDTQNNGVDNSGHGAKVFDLQTLRIDIQVPEQASCLGLTHRFFTEEVVGDPYDDGFVAELGSSNFTTDADGDLTAPNNFATDAAGNLLTVNTANLVGGSGGAGLFPRGTSTVTSTTPVAPGARSVFLSVWDDDDASANTAAFVDDLYVGRAQGAACARDTTAPETKIDKKPKRKTKKKKVKVKFSANEDGSTFECKLDKGDFEPCTSPHKAKAKKKGKHRLRIRATDAFGNVEATPAKVKWKRKVERK